MAKIEKLIAELKRRPKTFAYSDFVKIIEHLGYERIRRDGNTGGSRRAFACKDPQDLIMLDEPHGSDEMQSGMVNRLIKQLESKGRI